MQPGLLQRHHRRGLPDPDDPHVLVGFDPAQHPQLGFHYTIRDSELGEQSLAVGSEFPYASDPSLWQTIQLVEG